MASYTKELNLFHWATSELSQDAFICWLLSQRSNKNDPRLQDCSRYFMQALIKRFDERIANDIGEITSVSVYRQYCNIDILVVINHKYGLVIEDKVEASNHSYQLIKYENIVRSYTNVKNNITSLEPILIYLKTGNEYKTDTKHEEISDKILENLLPADKTKILKAIGSLRASTYKTFYRSDFLSILNSYNDGIKNSIFLDFVNYLQFQEDEYLSYMSESADKWSLNAWKGFFDKNRIRYGVDTKEGVGQYLWGIPMEQKVDTSNVCLVFNITHEKLDLNFRVEYGTDSDRRRISSLIDKIDPQGLWLRPKKRTFGETTRRWIWKSLNRETIVGMNAQSVAENIQSAMTSFQSVLQTLNTHPAH